METTALIAHGVGLEELDKMVKAAGMPVGPITLADEVHGLFRLSFRLASTTSLMNIYIPISRVLTILYLLIIYFCLTFSLSL